MVVLDAYVRDIIGSFHPSRPILTNGEIYRKILEINPEFSLYRLYLRYNAWYNRKMDETDLCKELSDIRFYAFCPSYLEPITIYTPLGRNGSDKMLELIYIEGNNGIEYFDTVDDVMQIIINDNYPLYNDIHQALVEYIMNYISNPSCIKPYLTSTYNLQYSHVIEPIGSDNIPDEELDEYVNAIQKIDPKFSLSKLYYTIHQQYMLSKKLDRKYIPILSNYINDLTYITYDSYDYVKTVTLWNDEVMLYTFDNATENLFYEIVANLYHGINTSEINLNVSGMILVDTYHETEKFITN